MLVITLDVELVLMQCGFNCRRVTDSFSD